MMATITRMSILTGIESAREIEGVTQLDVDLWLFLRMLAGSDGCPLLQDAFPGLSEEDHEFILSGITPEVWAAEVGQPGDDE